jgi:predicted DsbA family dithiol-disulfide isomerase
LNVRWVYFPLHPDTPAEGLPLKELFAGRGYDLEAMHTRMKRLMDLEGLPYSRRTYTYNSRSAQELAKWADSQPGFESIHAALYRAYFVDGRNIGKLEVLVDIAQSVGLSADSAQAVLTNRTFKDAVDQDWDLSRQSGVTGVPTFIAGQYKVVGAQPYDVLANLIAAVNGNAHESSDA